MGSSLQRIEVLLVGLVLLIAGAVVVILTVLRPASPTSYIQATPQPIETGGTVRPTTAPLSAPTSMAAAVPTAVPIATAAVAASSAPVATTASVATIEPLATPVPPTTHAPRPTLIVPPMVNAIWPWLLLSVGLGGGAIVILRMRKRRMTYTSQSVGQLLAAADDVTRATNLRIMRGLAEQGVLTAELAAAAGIDLRQRRNRLSLRLPRLRLPRLAIPPLLRLRLRLPKPRLPRIAVRPRSRPLTIDLAPATPAAPPPRSKRRKSEGGRRNNQRTTALIPPFALRLSPSAPAIPEKAPASGLSLAALADPAMPALLDSALRDALAAQAIALPEVESPPVTDTHPVGAADPWTAEDRALAVAAVLAGIWADQALTSPILALDTPGAPGDGQVIVTLDGHPDEEEQIVDLPDLVVERQSAWRASWRQDMLAIEVRAGDARPPGGGPLLVPILAHGRGGKTTRFFPLASWRHLGLYGGSALHALHAVLGSLLYNQPPSRLALAIIDNGEITPLYRDVAHLIPLPSPLRETIEELAQAIKRRTHGEVRPLVLVVVEPDDMLLNLLIGITARLRVKPATTVHLLIAQERLSMAGRELYAMLPALITSGGRGPAALLPGQGEWPKRGEARLVGRGMRAEGRATQLDEAGIAAQLTEVRGKVLGLPPVLWDEGAAMHHALAATRTERDEHDTIDTNPPEEDDRLGDDEIIADVEPNGDDERSADDPQPEGSIVNDDASDEPSDDDARRRRLAQALVDTRQRLIDRQDGALTPSADDQIPQIAERAPTALAPETGVQRAARRQQPELFLGHLALPPADERIRAAARSNTAPDRGAGNAEEGAATAAPDTTAPHQRRAALLRATLQAGRLQAPALPRQSAPRTAETPAAATPATNRPPADRPPAPQPMAEPDNGWPIGPAPVGRVALAELMARVASAPTIIAGQSNEVGVTKNRLVELLKGTEKAQAKELAEILMVWLDLASLLAEPTRPGRLRHPRALVTTNLIAIAERLNATPCPDKLTVHDMWARSNEGRN